MLILFYRYPDAQLRDFNVATLVLDPLNGTTGFTYDANGNLLSVNRGAQQRDDLRWDQVWSCIDLRI
jgi:YD repeat-containing protein